MLKVIEPHEFVTLIDSADIQNLSNSNINYSEGTVEPDGSEGYGYILQPLENLKYTTLGGGSKCYLYNPNSIPVEVQI